jgi:transposase
MDKFEQRVVMKFFFLQGERYKAIYQKLHTAFAEESASLSTVKRWCRRFKSGHFSVQDDRRSGRPQRDLGDSISQFLADEPFLSARTLAKRLLVHPQTIKRVLTEDLGMRKFTRRWIPHELSLSNRQQRVELAETLPRKFSA